ncbi:MAG: hypothetical protein ACLTEH_03815 [Clostridia bacterium]
MGKYLKSIALIIVIIVILIFAGIKFYEELNPFIVTTYFTQTNSIEEINKVITTKIKLKDYEIVFFSNKKFYMKYKGEEIELRDSLINKTITIDKIIEQAEQDCKNNIASKNLYLDGGSIQYIYQDFSIIKKKSLDGNRNVYIGDESLDINNL